MLAYTIRYLLKERGSKFIFIFFCKIHHREQHSSLMENKVLADRTHGGIPIIFCRKSSALDSRRKKRGKYERYKYLWTVYEFRFLTVFFLLYI